MCQDFYVALRLIAMAQAGQPATREVRHSHSSYYRIVPQSHDPFSTHTNDPPRHTRGTTFSSNSLLSRPFSVVLHTSITQSFLFVGFRLTREVRRLQTRLPHSQAAITQLFFTHHPFFTWYFRECVDHGLRWDSPPHGRYDTFIHRVIAHLAGLSHSGHCPWAGVSIQQFPMGLACKAHPSIPWTLECLKFHPDCPSFFICLNFQTSCRGCCSYDPPDRLF